MNLQNKNIKVLTELYVYLLQNFLKYRILFKDILAFLGFDYRDALLGISTQKSDQSHDYVT